MAVLHLDLPDDQLIETLAVACDLSVSRPTGVHNRDQVQALLPPGVTVAGEERRAHTLVHVTFDAPSTDIMSEEYCGWPPSDQWLWQLAAATPPMVFPPDPDDAALFSGRVRFSRDWQCLVLRDGAAFVGLTPDNRSPDSFHDAAEAYVHSLYLDVFLLGRMQRACLHRLANDVASVRARRIDARVLVELELCLNEVRTMVWSSNVTTQGKGNELLERYQEQNRLPALFDRIVADLEHSARLVDAMTNRRINAALGLLTIIGLPFGVVYAAGQLWSDNPASTVGIWTAIAAGLAVLLSVALAPVRAMLRGLLPSRLSHEGRRIREDGEPRRSGSRRR